MRTDYRAEHIFYTQADMVEFKDDWVRANHEDRVLLMNPSEPLDGGRWMVWERSAPKKGSGELMEVPSGDRYNHHL